MVKCPHCGEDLVIRTYFETWVDYAAIICKDGTLDANQDEEVDRDFDPADFNEPTDYECANCKENVKDLIGNVMK